MIDYDRLTESLDGTRVYDRYVSALCPFHEDTSPSLLVFKDGWYRCLACGATGTHDQLWNHINGRLPTVRSSPPVQFNSPYFSPDLEESEQLVNEAHDRLKGQNETLGWYLKLRKLQARIEPQRLGWHHGWYTVPVYGLEFDNMGYREYKGMVARADKAIQYATGNRYTMPARQDRLLYVPDLHLVNNSDYICVVFGVFDALALTELRIPSATFTTGKQTDYSLLDWCRKPILIIPDRGEYDAALKLAGQLDWRAKLLRLNYDDTDLKDPADYVENNLDVSLITQIRSIV